MVLQETFTKSYFYHAKFQILPYKIVESCKVFIVNIYLLIYLLESLDINLFGLVTLTDQKRPLWFL